MATHHRIHLGMGRSFQVSSLCTSLSVLDNVSLALQGTQSSRFQMFRPATSYTPVLVRAQKLLETMNLWGKRDQPVSAISYGEQRKMEIALSLASDPKLLLLDEPSCGLTSAESADVLGIINSLGPDKTIILVAHDMDLVFSMAQRIIVLHYGQVIADGIPEEIRANSMVREVYMGTEENT